MKEQLDTAVALEVSLEFPVMKSKSLLVKILFLEDGRAYKKQEYILGFERFKFRNKAWRSNRNRWSNGAGKSTLLRLIAGIYVQKTGLSKPMGRSHCLRVWGQGSKVILLVREHNAQ